MIYMIKLYLNTHVFLIVIHDHTNWHILYKFSHKKIHKIENA